MRGRIVDHLIDLIHSAGHARSKLNPLMRRRKVCLQLRLEVVTSLLNMAAPTHQLDELFSAERNQHADNDDAYLAEKLAPAVQRFGKVEVHAKGPPARRRLADEPMSAMGRKLSRQVWVES